VHDFRWCDLSMNFFCGNFLCHAWICTRMNFLQGVWLNFLWNPREIYVKSTTHVWRKQHAVTSWIQVSILKKTQNYLNKSFIQYLHSNEVSLWPLWCVSSLKSLPQSTFVQFIICCNTVDIIQHFWNLANYKHTLWLFMCDCHKQKQRMVFGDCEWFFIK